MTEPAIVSTPRRVGTRSGIVVAAVLCVLLAAWMLLLDGGSLLGGFVSDSCGERGSCNFTQISCGILAGIIGVTAVSLAAIVVAIVRGIRHRAFVWIWPLGGGVAALVVFLIAATITFGGAHIDFWNQP